MLFMWCQLSSSLRQKVSWCVYYVVLVWVPLVLGMGPVVHAPAGSIRGVPAPDGDYVMFLGIPYARVNASNPFGAAIRQGKFDKTFEANNESEICPQMKEEFNLRRKRKDAYDGTLDCLRLNVFVPNSDTKNKATFIYVYGGLFKFGHSLTEIYGPRYLVRHDIIVVTFNFRSGPYGFMCMDIPEIPGNQGLRDQYAAIEWVRDNIRAFGGDPRKLTLGGHSSGAILVDMHVLTNRPRLFQQVILQSGVSTGPDYLMPSNTKILISIANEIGFKTNDTYAALSFLARASPRTLIKAGEKYDWKPCVEKKFEGVTPFITTNPELSDERNVDGLKILGGFTDREFMFSLYFPSYRYVFDSPNGVRDFLNAKKLNPRNESDLVDIVHRFYVDDGADREVINHQIVGMLSDCSYVYPMQRQLLKYSRHRNTAVYMYLFTYDGRLNRMKNVLNTTEAGAAHSDELGYMFTMDFVPDAIYCEERLMIDRLTILWANFIKYGDPTPVRSALLPVSWPLLTADTISCLQIGTNLTVISRPYRRRMAFWDLYFDAYLDELLIARAQN